MTEYWKSQTRKYCEFCKCWYADNKVSISFHENGKRHKENVQKHISKLSKKSAKDYKQKEKMNDDISKMEAAAMAAYLKDVQNNADLTSQSINNMIGQINGNSSNPPITTAEQPKPPPIWHEVKNDDGSSYYWNTDTNETTWDAPDEYLSIAEQEKEKLKEMETEKKNEKKKEIIQKEKQKESQKELKAFFKREQMKELKVKREDPQPVKNSVVFGPAPHTKPYGTWKAVVNETEKEIDLQLPKVKPLPPPPVIVEPEIIQFTEKRLEPSGEGPVEFKKRKLNNHKRNMRQKLDDD